MRNPTSSRSRGAGVAATFGGPGTIVVFGVSLFLVALASARCVGGSEPTAAEDPRAPAIREIAPGVHLRPGTFVPGQQPDGNSVILEVPGGLVVIDTGRHAEHTQQLMGFAETSGRPIVAVVNTHWHLDHIGGNLLLRGEIPDLKIWASGAIHDAREGFLASYRGQLERHLPTVEDPGERERLSRELALLDAGEHLLPTHVVSRSETSSIGGALLELHLESDAVTAGDVWVRIPRTGVLVAGDLVTLPVPFLDTACPARWLGTLDRLAGEEFTLLVPGHGPPMARADLRTYRDAFRDLLGCAASESRDEECAQVWVSSLGDLLPATEHDFARQLLAYYIPNHLRHSREDLCRPASEAGAVVETALAAEVSELAATLERLRNSDLGETFATMASRHADALASVGATDDALLQLYRLRDPFVGIRTLELVVDRRDDVETLAAFEELWRITPRPDAPAAVEANGPVLQRALVQAATNKAGSLRDASLVYAEITSPANGLFYLAEAEGHRRFAAFAGDISLPADTEPVEFDARRVAREIATVERHAMDLLEAGTDQRAAVVLGARLKEARELLDAGAVPGAVLALLESRMLAGHSAATLQADADDAAAGGVSDSIEAMLAAMATGDAKQSRAVLAELLPLYRSLRGAGQVILKTRAASVAVTLLRWPDT